MGGGIWSSMKSVSTSKKSGGGMTCGLFILGGLRHSLKENGGGMDPHTGAGIVLPKNIDTGAKRKLLGGGEGKKSVYIMACETSAQCVEKGRTGKAVRRGGART